MNQEGVETSTNNRMRIFDYLRSPTGGGKSFTPRPIVNWSPIAIFTKKPGLAAAQIKTKIIVISNISVYIAKWVV